MLVIGCSLQPALTALGFVHDIVLESRIDPVPWTSMPLRSFRRLVLPLVVALASACGPVDSKTFPDEDRLLEGLMEDYVSERFRFYPVESTLAGLPGNDGSLGSFSRSDFARRIFDLSDFHKKLIGLRLNALSQPSYLDALWLTSLVKSELFDLEERRIWERSPSFYGDTIRVGLVSLLLAPDVDARTDSLRGRLEAIPALLDQARENLGSGSESFGREGMRSLSLCGELLTDMPLLLEERLPSYRVAELAERSRLATRTLQALTSRFPEPRSGPGSAAPPLGADGLGRFLRYREMVDWSPERLLREAETLLAVTTNAMTELTLDRLPDPSLDAALSASGATGSPGEEAARYQELLLSLPGKDEEGWPQDALPVRVVPRYFLAPHQVRLWRSEALAPAREAALLVSSATDGLLSRELQLLTLTEGIGRYREYVRQSESASLLRRVFRTRTTSEGWLLWYRSRLFDRGYGTDDPELGLRHLHQTGLEALRLSVAVRMHAFGMGIADAEREFLVRGRLAPERAAAEADRAAIDPGAGSAALGRLLLEDLASDYLRRHSLTSPSDLDRLLLSEGLVPIRLVRFKLLGLDSE
jgi:hypothetical protein